MAPSVPTAKMSSRLAPHDVTPIDSYCSISLSYPLLLAERVRDKHLLTVRAPLMTVNMSRSCCSNSAAMKMTVYEDITTSASLSTGIYLAVQDTRGPKFAPHATTFRHLACDTPC